MEPEHHEIVIVGGGFSGIGTTIALTRAGFDDVLVVDDADGPGGVWQWNTYPGVAVDIPSFSYQFSFAQGSQWTRSYAPGHELKAYAERCVDEYGIGGKFRFRTRVASATYADGRWRIETSTGPLTARWMIHAGGPLSQPKLPDIPGLDEFAGPSMHTSRWDHSIALDGKRVGIIGTGATAVQVIPEIAPVVERLTVFQRTPIWCLPKFDFPIPAIGRRALAVVPGAKALSRLASQAYVEATFPVLAHFHRFIPGTNAIEHAARQYLATQVHDAATRDRLTPRYALGCKRPSFHNSYLATFNRSNVDLETGSIEEITATGVRTADGVEHELDVLILATGFKVTDRDALPTYELIGPEGENLADRWDRTHLRSYQGVSTVGFPNYFTVFGPYGYNGASFFTLVENSAAHIVRVLREARRRDARTVEVTAAAQDAYMESVLARRGNQVFADPTCANANSYYFTKNGDVPFRASTTLEATWSSRRFPLSDYVFAP
ncbi:MULTISPECIES: flavin-containing monooxygenase [Tsukamurella]|uniref:NAD(P)/FAD-dependent oxidoreductase n=2 Tax=Tsukamurella TaxID=2060 RepID=A0A5C5S0J5_9ACTN|nr:MULTISPECIES: NAD(P)/FAD-dependent oxidoreductase [Tsukamurella]NMD54297.1 NAD(P)/FAD-dependent oxidoreductase [Tsukamurella columbiensis]TWS28188.1 NAD(P)/FAD-dependent oxidoreductase [Tsukamurella conjunctivitidis]